MLKKIAPDFVRRLAKAKARAHPPLLRASAQMAYSHRWMGLLAVAAQRALAATLLELPIDEVRWRPSSVGGRAA